MLFRHFTALLSGASLAALFLAACGGGEGPGSGSGDAVSGDAGQVAADAGDAASVDDNLPDAWNIGLAPGPGAGRIEATFADCLYASPLVYESPSRGAEILVTGGDVVIGVDPATGQTRWTVDLPERDGLRAFAAATPALRGSSLLVGFALRDVGQDVNVLDEEALGNDSGFAREAHAMAVVDVEAMDLDARFPLLELEGSAPSNEGGEVSFLPSNAFMRSEIGWWGRSDETLGLGYATFGNVRDLQPWHGWAFEIDLDAWAAGGEAISAILTTTPEEDCGASGASGSFQRVCGGGLWSPSGSIAIESGDSFDVIFAPGNGQLDLTRGDYANTLMRVSPGLAFDPACDETLCADFDPDEPSHACVESCQNLFVPRMITEGDAIDMPDGRCDGLAFFECWAEADFIGGSTPLLTEAPAGERVLVYPTKDGHAYLVDADNLGTMYDREQLVSYCGTPDDPCVWTWSGTVVSEPVQTVTDDVPRILIPTFMPDSTNPAGVVALTIVDTGDGPALERAWEFPNFSSDMAFDRFRRHPGRLRLAIFNGLEVAILSEPSRAFERGRMYVLRASDGRLLAEARMEWPGYRFTQPAFHDGVAYVNSCESDGGRGTLETFQLVPAEANP